jgi:putative flippase GtrA
MIRRFSIGNMFAKKQLRYLIAGAWNTFFGYSLGVMAYYTLRDRFHLLAILTGCNIAAISMSFLTYKVFVFKTKGNWLAEYCRAYIIYGVNVLLGIFLLWTLVDRVGIPFWIGQALIILATMIASYIGHSKFTFR